MAEIDIGGINFRLNFWDQMEKAFLMDRTPNQLFNFISKSKEQDLVNDLSEEKKVENSFLSNEIKTKYTKIDVYKTDIVDNKQTLSILQPFLEFDLETFEKLNMIDTQLKDLNINRVNLDNETKALMIETQRVIEENKKLEAIHNKLQNIMEELNKLTKQEKEIMFNLDNQINTKKYISNCKAKINDLQKENEEIEIARIKALEAENETHELYNKIAGITALLDKYNKTNIIIKQILTSIETTKLDLQKLELEYSEIDVCPFCGSDLTNEHSH